MKNKKNVILQYLMYETPYKEYYYSSGATIIV